MRAEYLRAQGALYRAENTKVYPSNVKKRQYIIACRKRLNKAKAAIRAYIRKHKFRTSLDFIVHIPPEDRKVPLKGAFIGYKKVLDTEGLQYILELRIPANALRLHGDYTEYAADQKCRASHVKVLSAKKVITCWHSGDSVRPETVCTEFFSSKQEYTKEGRALPFFKYRVGKIAKCRDRIDPMAVNCSRGIHFFMTEDAALRYRL